MTTQHRATHEQWQKIEEFVKDCGYDSCLLELRARVEALEATQRAAASAEARPGGLVEGVAKALHYAPHPPGDWKPEARAAIRAVADWLHQQELHIAATRLRQEAQ